MRLPACRLDRQLISRPRFATPAEVVVWFGAVQAQDYLASLWAVGLRLRRSIEPMIEAAIAEGRIIRTHTLRGTLQLVAREDVRWMLALVGPRVLAGAAGRCRQLELDAATLARADQVLARALAGGQHQTRHELAAILERAGISTAGQRLIHLIAHAELTGIVCSGARRGKQQTFALLDERVPAARAIGREQALRELAVRYFQSHGPATLRDFVWWSGLTMADARTGIEHAGAALASESIDGTTCWFIDDKVATKRAPAAYLLPAFDEYLVGYQDRGALLDPKWTRRVNNGGGLLSATVVIDGQVRGTWKRSFARGEVVLQLDAFGRWSRPERDAIAAAAERYGAFVGATPRLVNA